MRIFISSLFKNLLDIEQCCLELGYYKLGTLDDIKNSEGNFIESLEDLRMNFLDQDKGRSPSNGVYTYDGILFPHENKMTISLKVPEGDQGLIENSYKAIYCIYKNLLTDRGDIAFIITGDKLDNETNLFIKYINNFGEEGRIFNSKTLNLSTEKNIITFNFPTYRCNLTMARKDEDIIFLEGCGIGNNYNIYRYLEKNIKKSVDKNFLSKNSFDSYYKTTRSDDDYSHDNTVFINKFGIKIY